MNYFELLNLNIYFELVFQHIVNLFVIVLNFCLKHIFPVIMGRSVLKIPFVRGLVLIRTGLSQQSMIRFSLFGFSL